MHGRTHLPNTEIPLSRASGHGLSILLDNANGSGSTAQGMFGYFHFHFVDVRGTPGGRVKLRKQGTRPARHSVARPEPYQNNSGHSYYVFRSATGCRRCAAVSHLLLFAIGDTCPILPRKTARNRSPNICRLSTVTGIIVFPTATVQR